MKQDILVYIEQRDRNIQRISSELISGARELANHTAGRVVAVIPGFQMMGCVDELIGGG